MRCRCGIFGLVLTLSACATPARMHDEAQRGLRDRLALLAGTD
jgi:hypothetical protein